MIHHQLTHHNCVAVLTLARPEAHNALNPEMVDRILDVLNDLKERKTLRVLVIRGEGASFCAGADLAHMRAMGQADEASNRAHANRLAELMEAVEHFPHPTVALVQGAVYGGGVGLVAACDIALAVDSSTFCFSEVKLGLVPAVISPYVVAAMGARQARRYMLTAECFDAARALHVGLVHQVMSEGEWEAQLAKVIDSLLVGGPHAHTHVKRLIERVANAPFTPDLRAYTVDVLAQLSASAEGREGVTAFLEKRRPSWVTSS